MTRFITLSLLLLCAVALSAAPVLLSPRQAALVPARPMIQLTPRSTVVIATRLVGLTNFVDWGSVWTTNLPRFVTINRTNLPSPPPVNMRVSWTYPDAVRVSSDLTTWTTNEFQITATLSDTNNGGARFYQVPIRSATAGVTLFWDASPSPDVVSYTVYFGNLSHNYTDSIPGIEGLEKTITGLNAGGQYYFAVTATRGDGLESDYSDEFAVLFPMPPVTPVISAGP